MYICRERCLKKKPTTHTHILIFLSSNCDSHFFHESRKFSKNMRCFWNKFVLFFILKCTGISAVVRGFCLPIII